MKPSKKTRSLDDILAMNRKRILAGFNFGGIKTFRDFLLVGLNTNPRTVDYIQYPTNQLDQTLTRDQVINLMEAEEWRLKHYQYDYTRNNQSVGEIGGGSQIANGTSHDETQRHNDSPSKEIARVEREETPVTIPRGTKEVREIDVELMNDDEMSRLYNSIISPKQKATLFSKQLKAAQELLHNMVVKNYHGQLLLCKTGGGKTFILAALIRKILDHNGWLAKRSLAPWKMIYVTKSSIVPQTARVLETAFGINLSTECICVNIDQLRATYGEMFIKWENVVKDGESQKLPVWKKLVHPCVFILDESQAAKNEDSLQSKVFQAVNDIWLNYGDTYPVYLVSSSATPFTKVAEAKVFAVSTRHLVEVEGHYNVNGKQPLTNTTWSSWAKQVAYPADPDDHVEAAIERLIGELHPYIVDVKGLRSQFNALNSVKVIPFQTPAQQLQYTKAWEAHLERKAKLENKAADGENVGFSVLASFTIFRCEAEAIRAEYIADYLHQCWLDGYAGVAACCFKRVITSVVKFLIEKHGYSRDDISLIWGGMNKTQKKKVTKKDTIRSEEYDRMKAAALAGGMPADMLDELLGQFEDEVEEVINTDIDPLLRMGNQTRDQRQSEIDKFNSGRTKFCIFTFKSGGVGLSLHHSDELTKYKVRRKKESGYYVESDIINCQPVRPRKVILTPTYSAIEMVQGLGRCPRLTSMSDTPQEIVFYQGTIEEAVAATVSKKLRCLKKVVRQRESWEDIILGAKKHVSVEDQVQERIKALPDEVQDGEEEEFESLDMDEEEEE